MHIITCVQYSYPYVFYLYNLLLCIILRLKDPQQIQNPMFVTSHRRKRWDRKRWGLATMYNRCLSKSQQLKINQCQLQKIPIVPVLSKVGPESHNVFAEFPILVCVVDVECLIGDLNHRLVKERIPEHIRHVL